MSAQFSHTIPEHPTPAKTEPSMQEILHSIRHTITRGSDVKIETSSSPSRPEASPEECEDILELTEIAVEEDTRMPASFLTGAKKRRPLFFPAAEPPHPELSDSTIRQTGTSLQQLMQAIRDKQPHVAQVAPIPPTSRSTTIEELVSETVKPALIEWMDQYLPALVERIVEREIKAIIEKHVTTVI